MTSGFNPAVTISSSRPSAASPALTASCRWFVFSAFRSNLCWPMVGLKVGLGMGAGLEMLFRDDVEGLPKNAQAPMAVL